MKALAENVSTDVFPLARSVSRRWVRPGGEDAEHRPVESWWKSSRSARRGSSALTSMKESGEDEYEASTTPLLVAGENPDHTSGATTLIATWMRKKERYDFHHRSFTSVAKALSGARSMEEGQFGYSPSTSAVPGRGPQTGHISTASAGPGKLAIKREGTSRAGSGKLTGTFLVDIDEIENWSGRPGTITTFHIPSTKETFEHVRVLSDFETGVWCQQIARSTTRENVFMILRSAGLKTVGDRVRHLDAMEAEEPDPRTISLGSLKELARFLISERRLGLPSIGVSPDGLAHAQWRIPENGMLAMQFHASGDIRFAAISGPFRSGIKRDVVYGTRSKEKTLEAIRRFTALLESKGL